MYASSAHSGIAKQKYSRVTSVTARSAVSCQRSCCSAATTRRTPRVSTRDPAPGSSLRQPFATMARHGNRAQPSTSAVETPCCHAANDSALSLEIAESVASWTRRLVGATPDLPVEERQLVGEFAVALRLGRAHAVSGVEVHQEQHRPAAGGRRLQVRGHLARLPRRHAWIVEAG